ncbi:flagellar motor stator protein MotA [Kosakonia arachidis]|uniref:flagellar motor stator protein MotA n=1 Tax=Kosakonia arachidis TaxID=551989 RepID=UPI000B7C7757|nr:flagellar motor stator protein MotA [Kosakonia arachidis]
MLVVLGYFVVLAAVIGGFALTGGELGAFFQPSELLIIGGAGLGAFIVGNNAKALKATLKALPLMFKGSQYNKSNYLDLLALLFLLLGKSRQYGMMSLEADIEDPHNSAIFMNYPRLLADVTIMNFVVDYLRLMVSGSMNAFEIEALIDEEIDTAEHEAEQPAGSINSVGDALPAFGIVAAVMGVVHALASADRPAAELGELIAHAMVGTFLGILLAYGFILPLASLLRQKSAEKTKVLLCIKAVLLAAINGSAPQIAVEFGRKTLFSGVRPTFYELEEHVRQVKSAVQSPASENGS